MYHYRDAERSDFDAIAAMPQNPEEFFYMFPRGSYPPQPAQLAETAAERRSPTVVRSASGDIAAYRRGRRRIIVRRYPNP